MNFKRSALRRAAAMALCLGMLFSLAACGEGVQAQKQLFAMDTTMTLTAYGRKAEAGIDAAASVINAMDTSLDPENTSGIIYAINHAEGANTAVTGQVASMLGTAQLVYQRSGGAMDPSIYPLVKLWGFIDGKYYVPTADEISEALSKRCFDGLTINSFPSSGGYSVSIPAGGEIGLGAVAKGAASAAAVDAMRQAGVESGIVSLGGNVQTLGLKPDGTNWTVAVQDPNYPESYLGVLSVGETAVVTSGSYQRSFTDMRNHSYHHILNPATGSPTANSLVSVTIICTDGTMADCLSTAMFVLGENKALDYWRTYGGFEMIMVNSSNEVTCTKGLIEKFTLSNASYTLRFSE